MRDQTQSTGTTLQSSPMNGTARRSAVADSVQAPVVVFEGECVMPRFRALENIVRTVARHVADDHDDARILEWQWTRNASLAVTTSTELLAYEIAESVREALGGRILRVATGGRRALKLTLRLDR